MKRIGSEYYSLRPTTTDGISYVRSTVIGATRFTCVKTDLGHGKPKSFITHRSGDERGEVYAKRSTRDRALALSVHPEGNVVHSVLIVMLYSVTV